MPRSGSLPIGLEERHVRPTSPTWIRSALILLLIGGPLALAMFGVLGGGNDRIVTVRTPAANLTIETPHILRSGNWFETRIVVEPLRDTASLSVAIDQPLWRGMSIDTAIPDAEKVEATGGRFTYSFGPVARGEKLVFKLDGQIQPRGFRRVTGTIDAKDGEVTLAELPITLTVLP